MPQKDIVFFCLLTEIQLTAVTADATVAATVADIAVTMLVLKVSGLEKGCNDSDPTFYFR